MPSADDNLVKSSAQCLCLSTSTKGIFILNSWVVFKERKKRGHFQQWIQGHLNCVLILQLFCATTLFLMWQCRKKWALTYYKMKPCTNFGPHIGKEEVIAFVSVNFCLCVLLAKPCLPVMVWTCNVWDCGRINTSCEILVWLNLKVPSL